MKRNALAALMTILMLVICIGGQASAATTTYNVIMRVYEPQTQPCDSVFVGTFDHDSATHTVTNLKGKLSESMTGTTAYPSDNMTWLPLSYQLQSWHDATLGGTFAAVFKNAGTNTFWTGTGGDGWSPQAGVAVGGVYYGFPVAGNNPGNASALIFVPDNPTDALSQSQIDMLAYADCAPGGIMGSVCMTGTSVAGYTAAGTMGGYPVEQVITVADTVPNTFSFTGQTGAALSSLIESDTITIGGISAGTPLAISGGEYSVSSDAGLSWSEFSTSTPATVTNGDQVKVRLTSSASYSSTTTATLTIGGVSGAFNVTTLDPPVDTVPDAFSFTPLTGVDAATAYESAPATISGINSPAAISIAGGSYALSTDSGATWSAWASTAGTVASGNQVKIRVTSSATANTTVTATLTIGGVAAGFSTTTNQYNAPPTWMPMTMLNITLGAGNLLAIVDLSTKSPFNTIPPTYPVLSTVASASTFDPAKPWAVLNGTAYSRRLGWNPGSGMNAAAIQAAFGPDASIWIEKLSSSDGLLTYKAVGSYGVNANNTTTIDPAVNGYAPIFGTSGSAARWQWDYKMDHNTNAVPAAYITTPNQHFTATYRIYIGDAVGNDLAPAAATTTTWGWTGPATLPANIPNAFSFTPVTGAAANTVVSSNAVTLSGNTDPSLISVSGGEYAVSVDGGSSWSAWSTTSPTTVLAGDQVKVRLTSSPLSATTTTASVTIGGVSADFSVTTADTVPETFSFTAVTGAATAFATASGAVTVTGISGAAPISISGGTSPQYSVSTDGGTTWSSWSATTPATVSLNNLVKVRQTSSSLPFTTTTTTVTIGGVSAPFSVTTGYQNPPSWMPMSMLSVAVTGNALSVVDEATKLGAGVYPAMTYIAPGAYDPTKPWSILNGGVAVSRQLGWDDPTAPHGNGIHVTGAVIGQVQTLYGAGAGIWIERISQSPGLETYFADGMYGVGGTGNAASGTPQVYVDANGFPIIYANNYYGIFGTDGSSTKWKWDGTMIHNLYAVPAAYITQPNQLFTATYRVYVGDSVGNDLAPAAATTEVWTWKGPASVPDNVPDTFSFTAQTGVALNTKVESNAVTLAGLAVPSLISITGGEYTISTDSGSTWSPWSTTTPATVANGSQVKVRQTSSSGNNTETVTTLTIGGVSGSFSVTTVALVAAAPTWLSVQTANNTGKNRIGWGASKTSGVTYLLEEATSADFTGATVVYSGINTNVQLSGRTSGTYWYRVKSTKTNYTDSGWTSGSNPTVVVIPAVALPAWISVQTANNTGNNRIGWAPSATAGVTYVLEEATSSDFSGATVAYTGASTSTQLSGRSSGTYWYRVKATKTDFVDSGWKTGANPTLVAIPVVAAPTWVSVRAHAVGGVTGIGWGPSATKDVTYVLEEATDAGFTTATVIYSGAATFQNPGGKAPGTYYYRVKATKGGQIDSPYVTGLNPSVVP